MLSLEKTPNTPTFLGASSATPKVCSQHEDRHFRHHLLEYLCGLDAIHYRHGEVEDNQVGFDLLGFLQCVHPVFCLETFEFQFLEVPTQGFADVWLVIDD